MRNNMTDEELMMTYKSGDYNAFCELYSRYHRRVYGYLTQRKGSMSSQSIDDVFQRVFLKLHKTRNKYDDRFNFQAWLFTITKSALIDAFRGQQREKYLESIDKRSDISQEIKPDSHKVSLAGLTSSDQEVIKLRYLEDKTFEEIGGRLGITPVTARQRVSRAVRVLRKLLKRGAT